MRVPSVTVNVDYFLHKESFPTLSEWDGLLSVSVPIFSAGTIEANVRTSWSQLRQAELQSRGCCWEKPFRSRSIASSRVEAR